MKIRTIIAAIISASLMLLTLSGCSGGNAEPGISDIDWENRDQRAEQFVAALVNGDYSIAAEGFSADMNRALGVRGLRRAWGDMIKGAGAFVSIAETQTEPHDEYDIYIVVSRHENRGVSSRVVFSEDGLIAGLFFSFAAVDA